jgi:hypothetical protein
MLHTSIHFEYLLRKEQIKYSYLVAEKSNPPHPGDGRSHIVRPSGTSEYRQAVVAATREMPFKVRPYIRVKNAAILAN